MPSILPARAARLFALVMIASPIAFVAPGCSTGPRTAATMRLTSTDATNVFVQRFTHSHATNRTDTATDVVLTGSPDGNLNQLMHLRLLWRPMRGTKTDQPSTTNAVIDWYVWENKTDAPPAVLKYSGAGLVMADRLSGGRLRIDVRNATMTLRSKRGDMVDPIGQSTLTGKFITTFDTAAVDEAMASIPAAIPRASAKK